MQNKFRLLLLCFPVFIFMFDCTSIENEIIEEPDFSHFNILINPNSFSSKYFKQATSIWIYNTEEALEYFSDYLSLPIEDNQFYLATQYIAPDRDRDGYSSGGTETEDLFLNAVKKTASIINDKQIILVIEPDELGFSVDKADLINKAVKIYNQKCPNSKIFIDIGNPAWLSAKEAARRLNLAGIEFADGFALNVSSFHPTDSCLKYGDVIAELLGGKQYVIDTSRNGGRNPEYPDVFDPVGIRLGEPPTFKTKSRYCFAYLWIKPPGEADGKLFSAGSFHPELMEK